MYIIDDVTNKKLSNITILLDKNEMKQLLGYAKQLLEKASSSEHYHLSSEDYQQEITICLFNQEKIDQYNSRIQDLIKYNE